MVLAMIQSPHSTPRLTHVAVTLRLADPASDLLVRRIALLRDCVALARHRYPFEIAAACILPSEFHLLCRLPEDAPMAPRLRLIRSAFARHCGAGDSAALWDPTVQEAIVPDTMLAARTRAVLDAPVRAGLVQRAEDWAWSSLHRRGAPRADPVAA
ncbi:MAG: transposase [Rhodobacteraceae bacterium HLUCCA08]|nr:MAG: transposase [Rhodobacteraceae bacterium HLUCCA08]